MTTLPPLVGVLLSHRLPVLASLAVARHVLCTTKAIKRPTLFGAQTLSLTTAESHVQNVTTQAGVAVIVSYCEVDMWVSKLAAFSMMPC